MYYAPPGVFFLRDPNCVKLVNLARIYVLKGHRSINYPRGLNFATNRSCITAVGQHTARLLSFMSAPPPRPGRRLPLSNQSKFITILPVNIVILGTFDIPSRAKAKTGNIPFMYSCRHYLLRDETYPLR